LKAANVEGTREILQLAITERVKPVHYISTLSVFPHKGETIREYVSEDAALDDYHSYISGGYAQSKWVAEKLVTTARERGLPVVIYRPGRITGHSQTGAWRTSDMLYQMLAGCIQLGMSPLLAENETLEMVPVDYVSQAIVALSRQANAQGQAFHLTQPTLTRVNQMLEWVKTCGYSLEMVEHRTWLAALAHARTSGQKNILAPLLELLPEPGPLTSADTEPPLVIAEARQTLAALAGSGLSCPPVDIRLLNAYLRSMVKDGTIEPPHSQSELSQAQN
jgi:thioester reductase-like protein